MSSPAGKRILLTGATGYIGGAVLDALIASNVPSLATATFDLLVRSPVKAEGLRAVYGSRVKTIHWPDGFKNPVFNADVAENYDLVLNAGLAFHPSAGTQLVEGLARRVRRGYTGVDAPWIIQIGGCSSLADRPITDRAYPDRVFDDRDPETVFKFIKSEDVKFPYIQRTNEVSTLESAEDAGVHALSLNTPLIFGEGKGKFSKHGIINPTNMRFILKHGFGFNLNKSSNFDWVHIDDLADLWVLIARTILEREDRGVGLIPEGRKGIIFPSVARVLSSEIMQRCLDAAFDAGVLPRANTPQQKEIREVELKDVVADITAGAMDVLECGWAGHKAMTGTKAKELFGWNPKRGQNEWEADFPATVKLVLAEGEHESTTDCIESVIGMK